jgi:hypothetical protein
MTGQFLHQANAENFLFVGMIENVEFDKCQFQRS